MARPSWLTLNKTAGTGNDTVQYTSEENTGRNQRQGIVTYQATGVEAIQQTVVQAGKGEYVSFTNATFSITNQGGSLTITGKSNSQRLSFQITAGTMDLFLDPIKYKAAGVEVNVGEYDIPNDPGASAAYDFEVTVYIAESTVTITKSCTFTAYCKDTSKSANCTVSQSGATPILSVSPASLSFSANEETKTTTVTSNTSWQIS